MYLFFTLFIPVDIYNDIVLENFLQSENGILYKPYIERDITKYCSTVVRYSSFCSQIPRCDERTTPPSFIKPTQAGNCSEQSLFFDSYYALCSCKLFYSMSCACKPPKCAPKNIVSFNVTCYKETSTICNYKQLNNQSVLAFNMHCYKDKIKIWVSYRLHFIAKVFFQNIHKK